MIYGDPRRTIPWIGEERMTRYGTHIDDGTVYVQVDVGRIEVGEVETIVEVLGGRSWTIEYDEREKRRHDIDTTSEGLTVDVVDTIRAMTFGESFVETLAAQPATVDGIDVDSVISPRLGLFLGRLMENLEYGVR